MVVEDRRTLGDGIEGDHQRRCIVTGSKVEDDEVRVAVVRILEAGDDIAVVFGEVDVADRVGKTDRHVALEIPHRFVAEYVPDDNRCVAAKLLCATEDDALTIVHHAAGGAHLIFAHLKRPTRLEVPDLQTFG